MASKRHRRIPDRRPKDRQSTVYRQHRLQLQESDLMDEAFVSRPRGLRCASCGETFYDAGTRPVCPSCGTRLMIRVGGHS